VDLSQIDRLVSKIADTRNVHAHLFMFADDAAQYIRTCVLNMLQKNQVPCPITTLPFYARMT
jgi:hypothetical protein